MRCGIVVLTLAFAPLAPGFQAPSTPAKSTANTAITANAEEVFLDLIVHDKHGRVVQDLRPEDLDITDDGSAVKLTALRLVSGHSGDVPEDTAKRDPLRNLRLVTLVFDRMGTDAGHLAREAAEEMVKASATRVSFAVLQVDHRVRLLQGFTTDAELLKRAIETGTGGAKTQRRSDSEISRATLSNMAGSGADDTKIQSGDLTGLTPDKRAMAQSLLDVLEGAEQISREQQARPSLGGLLAIAQQQGSLPGRKTVVYFSEGLSLTTRTEQLLHAIIGSANRANVSIYAMDASGLSLEARNDAARRLLSTAAQSSYNRMNAVPSMGNQAPQMGGPAGSQQNVAQTTVTVDQVKTFDRAEQSMKTSSQTPLVQLAESTGGFYAGETNDLRKPARRLMEDVTAYYEASYVPAILQYDGRFRSISVKARRAGLKLQARAGYFALPPAAGIGVQPFEASLLKVAAAAQLPNDFDFRMRVYHFEGLPKGVNNSVVLEVPLQYLEFHEDGTSKLFGVHFSVLALIKNKAGEVVHKFSQDVPYQGALEVVQQARQSVFTFQRHFTAEPGEYTLEAVVEDRNSGKTSARRFGCDVPAAPAKLGVSDVTLVRRREVFAADADPKEPFQYQNHKIVPNLASTLSRDTGEPVSMFFVIYPNAKNTAPPKLELEVLRDGEPLGRVPMELPKPADGGPIPYLASIPTSALRPGKYELRAIVAQGQETGEQSMSFSLDGQDIPGAEAAAARPAETGTSAPAEEAGAGAEGANLVSPDAKPHRPAVTITRLQDDAMRPDQAEQKRVLEVARKRALDYTDALPNFTCIEMTRRSVDPSGTDRWRTKDSITELLRYVNKAETRLTLEWNGYRSQASRADFKGTLSTGEFGALLQAVFDPDVKAEFEWKEWAALDSEPVHVFTYRVAAANSKYRLTARAGGEQGVVGFHGSVYVDRATLGVRRITMIADGIPAEFPFRESAITVDYEYVSIGGHDYLMPVVAQLEVVQGKRYRVRNELEFRDYQRYGAESKIKFAAPQ